MPSTCCFTQIEAAKGREKRLGIEALIETALGMQNIDAIAGASNQLEPCASAPATSLPPPAPGP